MLKYKPQRKSRIAKVSRNQDALVLRIIEMEKDLAEVKQGQSAPKIKEVALSCVGEEMEQLRKLIGDCGRLLEFFIEKGLIAREEVNARVG